VIEVRGETLSLGGIDAACVCAAQSRGDLESRCIYSMPTNENIKDYTRFEHIANEKDEWL
jgi:hypothetical protein